ncbi:hypothetical protein EIP91_001905 [Steccherinum ochraceum]|uniref:Ribosomal protein mS38 C-terminal domain-containing protein n=1 Tax=Steccherinum ochraceum TaxID=92696 RepID=A0A4R0RJE0_9APHY|nr:hypothetical protein EIP91_001905 [Steccherinum ochraceum]
MSVLSHFLRPIPTVRRAYSVFSKTGGSGGRYFNSAKPPKIAPPSTKGKVDASAPSSPTDPTPNAALKDDASSLQAKDIANESQPNHQLPPPPQLFHPLIKPQELQLHQFFSLHRPLLTLSQPTNALFERPPVPLSPSWLSQGQPSQFADFDNPPASSPESDADASRQLARAVVVNRVAPAVAWDDTLKSLGLDVAEGRAEEMSVAKAEYDMLMDSVKRKRKRKMKKHKLKKRRRTNRMKRSV